MTLEEFFNAWNGKKNDFDGIYEHQCVDLVKQYVKDVLNAPTWTGEPKDYGSLAPKSHFTHQKNTLLYIPPAGAIGIWDGNVGEGHGHVAIVTTASLMRFVSFDQNWPKGSPCILVNHNYKNVTGFLLSRAQDVMSKYNALVDDLRALSTAYPKLYA
jgi:hypothetical protein